ncbi:hypothetical protein [Maridesulfovibrio hydrothermalis]|uniref:SMODS and SLOG-associating 2TM effector domain-containing protein n=1 Tax=Maridesulfovibrio hydrothermalis AM13 = DSM 14728 TaxID=1121451 RepID=L0R9E8_9BACT|nr:hypothetical protein [Maridesulfovibrio hydrothermalis]CCO22211.1 membrane protein of unknown function [Maridesulfovibrio hydrothermalis AM13 = DSM 14728]
MGDFDKKQYQDGLTFIAQKGYDEYKIVAVDIPARQATYLRTYLWLSSLICAFQLNFYYRVISNSLDFTIKLPLSGFEYGVACLSFACSGYVFILAVDTLRGRGLNKIPLGDLKNLSEIAYDMATEHDYCLYPTIIQNIDSAIREHIEQIGKIGFRLRKMSIGIITSVLITIAFISILLLTKISLIIN